MEFSLHLSFYLRHSLRGYMVGTTTGFLVEIMEALAPQSCCRIPQKFHHMSTGSAHRRVIGSDHPLKGGLGGYCRGNVSQVPWVTGYSPKIWIQQVPSNSK
jgi:hypothetical protein